MRKGKARGLEGPRSEAILGLGNRGSWIDVKGSVSFLLPFVHVRERNLIGLVWVGCIPVVQRRERHPYGPPRLTISGGGVPPEQNQGAITRRRKKESRVDQNNNVQLTTLYCFK